MGKSCSDFCKDEFFLSQWNTAFISLGCRKNLLPAFYSLRLHNSMEMATYHRGGESQSAVVASSKHGTRLLVQWNESCHFLSLPAQQQKSIPCFSPLKGVLSQHPFCFLLTQWTDKYTFKHATVTHCWAVTHQFQLVPLVSNFVTSHKVSSNPICISIPSLTLANHRWLRIQEMATSVCFRPWCSLLASCEQLFVIFFRRRLDSCGGWSAFLLGSVLFFCFV